MTDVTIDQLALIGLGLFVLYCLFDLRDGRAIGSSAKRADLYAPGGWFLLGNFYGMITHRERVFEYIRGINQEAKRQGELDGKFVTVTIPGRRFIDITRPDLIEHVQKTNFDNYEKGPVFYANTKGVLGDGIFAVDGHKWFTQRKATAKIFNGTAFRGIISVSLQNNIDKLETIIKRHADNQTPLDLSGLFFRFTLNSFAEMAFGTDIQALSTETDKPVPFAQAFDYAQGVMDKRFTNPFWKVLEQLDGTATKLRAASKVMDDFAFGIIDQREEQGLGNFNASQKKEAAQLDLLSLYMAIRDEDGKPLSRRALRDAVLNLIIAGRDTTAQATAWTIFRLLTHPEWIPKIRHEVDQVGDITYDSYKTMTVTNAVFNEGLRLHPSVPKNTWVAKGDDQMPNGPRIRKGDSVFWSDWNMARDESIWGKDANQFNPNRWIDSDGQLVKETQWKAHMFNGGARICLGQDLAKFESVTMLATIIRQFDLEFAPGYLDSVEKLDTESTPMYASSLTLPMKSPMMVIAKNRKRA